MKKHNFINILSILMVAVGCITSGCGEPKTSTSKGFDGKLDSVMANMPDIFLGLESTITCANITKLTFHGEPVGDSHTDWEATWQDGTNTQNTYAVKLFDTRVSQTQPIWSWIVSEKRLDIGILEGRPDDESTPYDLAVVAICPNIGQSGIVVEDVAMK
jgi:hypothetical protein